MQTPDFSRTRFAPFDGARLPLPAGDLWVFGYGSLMWNPGFAVQEARPARLFGYHRRLCLWSIHYRGSARRPGLVLGLARGGSCNGMALRVARDDAEAAAAYLMQREMVHNAYRPAVKKVYLRGDGESRDGDAGGDGDGDDGGISRHPRSPHPRHPRSPHPRHPRSPHPRHPRSPLSGGDDDGDGGCVGDGESRDSDGDADSDDDGANDRGKIVEALTFLSKPEHPQFAPPLSIRDITAVVIEAEGKGGRNRDYVINTARHLSALDIERTEIHRVAEHLRRIA